MISLKQIWPECKTQVFKKWRSKRFERHKKAKRFIFILFSFFHVINSTWTRLHGIGVWWRRYWQCAMFTTRRRITSPLTNLPLESSLIQLSSLKKQCPIMLDLLVCFVGSQPFWSLSLTFSFWVKIGMLSQFFYMLLLMFTLLFRYFF